MTVDTAVNSESNLVQEVGKVVRASDLSDYSDHFTLGTKSLEEFEGFLKKHEKKGKRIIYSSDSEGSSVLYSLDPSTSNKPKGSKSDFDSGIIAGQQKLRSSQVSAPFRPSVLHTFFCVGEDVSIQGSYGGLRDDEILIANYSSISTKDSMPPQTVESQDIYDSRSEEDRDDQAESKSSETGSSESEGDGGWGISLPWVQVQSSSREDESENEPSTIPPIVSFVSSTPSRSFLPQSPSKSVTWEHSSTLDSAENSIADSHVEAIVKKARAGNILSMFKTKPADPPTNGLDVTGIKDDKAQDLDEHLKPTKSCETPSHHADPLDKHDHLVDPEESKEGEAQEMTESTEEIELKDRFWMNETKTDDSAKAFAIGEIIATNETPKLHVESDLVQMKEDQPMDDARENSDISTTTVDIKAASWALREVDQVLPLCPSHDARPVTCLPNVAHEKSETELSSDRSFVLGDNVVVSGILEIETGNGDTSFVIFLKATKAELTEKGQQIANRVTSCVGEYKAWHTMNDIVLALSGLAEGHEASIIVRSGAFDEPSPRLIIDGTARTFLDNLSKLSEASYYCLDSATKKNAENVVARRGKQAPDDPNIDQVNFLANVDDMDDELVYFMFCMRGEDTEPSPTQVNACSSTVSVANMSVANLSENQELETSISRTGRAQKRSSVSRVDEWESTSVIADVTEKHSKGSGKTTVPNSKSLSAAKQARRAAILQAGKILSARRDTTAKKAIAISRPELRSDSSALGENENKKSINRHQISPELESHTQDSLIGRSLPVFPLTFYKPPELSVSAVTENPYEKDVTTFAKIEDTKEQRLLLSYEARFRLSQKLLQTDNSLREARTAIPGPAHSLNEGVVSMPSALDSDDEFFDALSHASKSVASVD